MPGTSGTKYNDPIYLQRAQLLDSKWGPYNSVAEAQAAFPEAYRCIGLFQIINTPTGAKLYWYKNNTTDLVPFTGNSSVEVYDTFGDFPPVADASQDVIYIAKDTATSYYFNSTTDEYVPFEGESSVEVYPSRPNFPQPEGLINIIYIADDTNISYIWNPALLSGAGDYEVITGVGKSILTIERTSGDGSPGTTDTYTITYSDGTTYQFNIYNGDDGLDGDKYSTTTSSVTSIQTSGTLTLTTNDLNLDYIPAQEVIISLDSSTYMIGLVDSYDKTTGVMSVTITSGTGVSVGFTWYVNLNGAISIKGDTGDQGDQGEIGFPGFLYDNRRISTNQYTVGEIIYYSGQYYICLANNDAIVPVGGAIGVYWNPYSFEGDTGNGIDNIAWTSSTGGATPGIPGATDTYTVTYTDTTSDTFVVYNGADGDDVGGGISYYVAGGVADAYTVGAITTYNIGDTYLIKFEEPNTGISTLNGYTLVNSKTNNSDLVSGDIRINETHLVVFDADDFFQVLTIGPNSSLNPGGGGGSGAIVDMGDRLDGLELVDMGSRI